MAALANAPAARGGVVDRLSSVCHPSTVAYDTSRPVDAPSRLVELDDESRQWLARLDPEGSDRPGAIHALFELLHRAARHEARRRRGSLPPRILDELDDIARQAADDALAVLLRKLDDYRGASRFTTWAYKFAIFEVSAALRVRRGGGDRSRSRTSRGIGSPI